MSACENALPITEVDLPAGMPPSEALLTSDTPWVARGYLNEWPVVQHAAEDLKTHSNIWLASIRAGPSVPF